MTPKIKERIASQRSTWLVTGSAGFIGSHLIEALLRLGQDVVGLDDFSTGHRANLDEVKALVDPEAWRRFSFHEGTIVDAHTCRKACLGIDFVLHQAALGSVPRSLEDPLRTHAVNVTGFVNMLIAARDAGVKRFVYAASSSTYGDHPGLPKVEEIIGRPLSPYAVSKYANELYADVFARCYGIETIGLRYFNVFGARQDPEGAYAAVIPCWARALLSGDTPAINGDGETTRDFCYVANAVQANLLAALAKDEDSLNQIYNVAVGERTSLNTLFKALRDLIAVDRTSIKEIVPKYQPFRAGDVRHSQADISKAKQLLGYTPTHKLAEGLRECMPWYLRRFSSLGKSSNFTNIS